MTNPFTEMVEEEKNPFLQLTNNTAFDNLGRAKPFVLRIQSMTVMSTAKIKCTF